MKILQTLKEKLHNLKEKLPKKLFNKKTLIILVVIIAAIFAFFKFRKPKDMPIMAPEIRTTTLEKTSLVNSVSVNGTVKSINVVNVTTGLTYKVKEIAVQVGDNVKKGDIIAKLDSADIEKEIAEEKKKLAETKETSKAAFDKGTAKKDEAYNNAVKAEEHWHQAESARDVAYAPYKVASDSISVANSEYNVAYSQAQSLGLTRNAAYDAQQRALGAKNSADAAKTAADTAKANAGAAVTSATGDVATKQTAYTAAEAAANSDPTNTALAAARDAAKVALDTAQSALTAANTAKTNADAACVTADANAAAANNAYTSASSAFTTADTNHSGFVSGTLSAKEKALTSAKAASNYDAIAAAYNAAQTAVTTKKGEYDGMLKAYDAELEAYKTVRKTYEDASTSKTLEDLTKKLSECTIKSETNGVITAINAVVGSAMGQSANAGTGPLAVIQDTSNLVISTSFKEYDIPNIKIGQKVSIKSDATGDKVINGTVSQISLTANAGQNGSNDVSFPAEIQVSDSDSGLLVGMNAKANVILSQKDNIFVVPADAIGTNEKGEQVVYVKNGEIFEPVVVTTGEKNDFYTEIISTKLSVGTIVRSNADEAAAGMMSGGGMAAGGDTAGMSVSVAG